MRLHDILIEYYTVGQTNSYIDLLKKLDLYPALNDLANRFHRDIEQGKHATKISLFRKTLKELIAISMAYLKSEIHATQPVTATIDMFQCIITIIRHACRQCSVDFAACCDILQRYIDICGLLPESRELLLCVFEMQLRTEITVSSRKSNSAAIKFPGEIPITLSWIFREGEVENKKVVGEFAGLLCGKYTRLKTLYKVEDLFNPLKRKKVGVHNDDLCEILTIFSLFHQCGRIACTYSKALFQFLRSRIYVYPKGAFKGRPDFSMWNYETLRRMKDIDKFKNSIKEIFDIFCTTENDKQVFENFFEERKKIALRKQASDLKKKKSRKNCDVR